MFKNPSISEDIGGLMGDREGQGGSRRVHDSVLEGKKWSGRFQKGQGGSKKVQEGPEVSERVQDGPGCSAKAQ